MIRLIVYCRDSRVTLVSKFRAPAARTLNFYTFTLLAQLLQRVALLRFYGENAKFLRNPDPMSLSLTRLRYD